MANKIARPTTLDGWKKEATNLRRKLTNAGREIAHLESQFSVLEQHYNNALASIEHYRGLLAQEKKSWIKRLFSSKG